MGKVYTQSSASWPNIFLRWSENKKENPLALALWINCWEITRVTKTFKANQFKQGAVLTSYSVFFINPFLPNAHFLYPLKTSENLMVFWCFQGVEKGCIGNEWVNKKLHKYLTHSRSFSQFTKTIYWT